MKNTGLILACEKSKNKIKGRVIGRKHQFKKRFVPSGLLENCKRFDANNIGVIQCDASKLLHTDNGIEIENAFLKSGRKCS